MSTKKTTIILALVLALAGGAMAGEKEPAASSANSRQTPPAGEFVNPAKPGTRKLPRLVDLGATKCVPCKRMAPILEDLKKNNAGRLDVEFIDIWKNPEAGKKYAIRVIPTQIFFGADGAELFRHEGFLGKEDILAKWRDLGVELGAKPQ